MVTIVVFGVEASCIDYSWHCEDEIVELLLTSLLKPLGPGGEDPYPDLTAAQEAVKRFGGKIVKVYPVPKAVKGRVY